MMSQLQIEALRIRNEAVRPLLLGKEIDGWTALTMIVSPSEKLKEASLEAALKSKKKEKVKVKKKVVVTIEELAAS